MKSLCIHLSRLPYFTVTDYEKRIYYIVKREQIKGGFRPSLFLVLREEVGMIMCVSNAVASWDLTLRVLLQKLREKMTPE